MAWVARHWVQWGVMGGAAGMPDMKVEKAVASTVAYQAWEWWRAAQREVRCWRRVRTLAWFRDVEAVMVSVGGRVASQVGVRVMVPVIGIVASSWADEKVCSWGWIWKGKGVVGVAMDIREWEQKEDVQLQQGS